MSEEPKYPQPVVDGYNYYALTGKDLAVIRVCVGRAAGKASAVDPEHDRQTIFGRFCRCPNIEIETIFTQWWKLGLINGCSGRIGSLPAGIRKLCSFAHTLPRRCRLRRFPAKIAYRRRC